MTYIGWEFYSVNFSLFITMLASLILFLSVWFGTTGNRHLTRVDTMAGDEGEDW
jgi:hypothetical protein